MPFPFFSLFCVVSSTITTRYVAIEALYNDYKDGNRTVSELISVLGSLLPVFPKYPGVESQLLQHFATYCSFCLFKYNDYEEAIKAGKLTRTVPCFICGRAPPMVIDLTTEKKPVYEPPSDEEKKTIEFCNGFTIEETESIRRDDKKKAKEFDEFLIRKDHLSLAHASVIHSNRYEKERNSDAEFKQECEKLVTEARKKRSSNPPPAPRKVRPQARGHFSNLKPRRLFYPLETALAGAPLTPPLGPLVKRKYQEEVEESCDSDSTWEANEKNPQIRIPAQLEEITEEDEDLCPLCLEAYTNNRNECHCWMD